MSSSPSQDPVENVEAEEEAVAMEEETEETTIWDQARANSSKMIAASVMDDMENLAAKQKEELQQLRKRAEEAEESLVASRQANAKLEASLLEEAEMKKQLQAQVRGQANETQVLKESVSNEKERADRAGAESDRLREEIRYVRDAI